MTPLDDYRVIREGAALGELMARGRIAVSGGDRAAFLQGLLTNDIQALTPGSGCYAAWLTPQGRMTTDMHVLEAGHMILLDLPAAQVESVLERLNQFVFTEDVQLGNLTETLKGVAVHGPAAAAAIERGLNEHLRPAEWPDYHHVRSSYGGESVVIARIDQLGVPGFVLYVGSERADVLRDTLIASGARPVDAEMINAARIEAGYPLFGLDMDDDIIPLEAGIESRAISFSKGCYVGQEVVIRVLHRGHGRVLRKLVGLRFDSNRAIPRGTRLQAGGRDVGFITSSAVSPAIGTIALGYVHRDFVAPGSRVSTSVDGIDAAATVNALPFASAVE